MPHTVPHTGVISSTATSNDLIFTEEDVAAVVEPTAKFTRSIFLQLGITQDKFRALFNDYANSVGIPEDNVNYQRHNTLKSVSGEKVTNKALVFVLVSILEENIVEMSIKIEDDDGTSRVVTALL